MTEWCSALGYRESVRFSKNLEVISLFAKVTTPRTKLFLGKIDTTISFTSSKFYITICSGYFWIANHISLGDGKVFLQTQSQIYCSHILGLFLSSFLDTQQWQQPLPNSMTIGLTPRRRKAWWRCLLSCCSPLRTNRYVYCCNRVYMMNRSVVDSDTKTCTHHNWPSPVIKNILPMFRPIWR